ncbi:MAG: sigma-54 dependent transcriptional regulator [Cyclobacteriaceae bacterium]
MAGKVLIVDDNKGALSALRLLLEPEFNEIITLFNPNAIPGVLRKKEIDVVLLDMNFTAGVNSGNEGFYWLKQIKELSPNTEVIMLTAYGDIELAVKSVKEGAADFVMKPWENEKLLTTVHSALRICLSNKQVHELKSREKSLKSEINRESKMLVGSSRAMLKIMETVEKVANTDASVLITGENGTGKELIAQEIHQKSERSSELLVRVDMGAIPESLFESELFGHKKGSFTDAKEDRIGKFQLADRGTLFMDEIGNLPLVLQSKLLVVLQNRAVTPVGSNKVIPVDLRIISATNSSLEEEIAEQQFREDLLYRLNTIRIELPPLRERGEDIEELASFFLMNYQKKYKKHGLKLSQQTLKKLSRYHWPGNVRELQHAIEKAVILADSDILKPDDFSLRHTDNKPMNKYLTLEEMEKSMIEEALDKFNGNYSHVADKLGITRQTLYNKVKKYGL